MERTARLTMHNPYRAIRNSNMSDDEATGEYCDNSKDNKATIIEIDQTDNYIRVTDNGTGIKDTIEDIERVLSMAKSSNEFKNDAIGGYGIGLKEASMHFGKHTTIISTAPGCKTIKIELAWKEMDWSKGVPFEIMENGGHEQGTEITTYFDKDDDILLGREIKKPNISNFRKYARLLQSGELRIILNGIEQRIEEPELKEFKDYGKIGEQGFEFELIMGELKDNCKAPFGFYIYSKDTQIYFKTGSKKLDDNTDAIGGLYVCIALLNSKKNWRIAKNKNGIINIDVISENWQFRNALENWKTKIKRAKSSEMLNEISNDFAKYMGLGFITGLKGTRPNPGDKSGAIPPKKTGKKQLEWENVQPFKNGTHHKKGRSRQEEIKSFKVETTHFTQNNIDSLLSIDKSNNKLNVNLNVSNLFIKELTDNNKPTISKKLVLEQIVGLALGVNDIRGDQIQPNLVDLVFIQHELFKSFNNV